MADGTGVDQIYGPDYWHGAYHDALANWMAQHKFKRGAELGFAWGISARAYLETQVSPLISFDDNDNMYKSEAIKNEYGDQWELIQGDSSTNLLAAPGEFDFIYVDGDHRYEGVVKDLEASRKKLAKGGYIVCDDYGNPCGVKQAVDEFVKKYKFKLEHMQDNPNGGVILTSQK